MTVTPQLMPLLCIKVKDFVSSPLNFNTIKTTIAIINELFFAIIPMTNSSNKNKNDSLNHLFHPSLFFNSNMENHAGYVQKMLN